MTIAMAEQSWLTHSPKPRDTLPPAPSNLEGELLNLEGEQPLSQSVNSYALSASTAPILGGELGTNADVQPLTSPLAGERKRERHHDSRPEGLVVVV